MGQHFPYNDKRTYHLQNSPKGYSSEFFGVRRHGSPEAALAAAQEWEALRKETALPSSGVPTLRDLVVLYLRDSALHPQTMKAIARTLRGPAAGFAEKPADMLTRADLDTLRAESRARGTGPATTNKQQAYIRAALAWGVEHGYLQIHPWAGFKRLRAPKYQMQATMDDFRRIVAVAPPWMRWALMVCYATAARWGHVELFSLQWPAFDWQRRTVSIVQGKTGRPKVAPVGEAFLAEARPRFELDQAQGFAAVIHRGDGKPIRSYRTAWLCTLKRAGVDHHVRPYDIRHCVATAHLDRGVPLPVVADLLGHFSPQVTASVYSHAIDGRAREAAETLPDLTLHTPITHITH